MNNLPTISARMSADGQTITNIEGDSNDVLEMLAMLNRSVAMLMLEGGNAPEAAEQVLHGLAAAGFGMAVEDAKGETKE